MNDLQEKENRLERQVVEEAVRSRATDIHIDPTLSGYQVRFRVDGILKMWKRFDQPTGHRLINQIKADVGIDPGTVFDPRGAREKIRVDENPVDLRVTLVPCISGPKMAIRVLDSSRVKKRLHKLGLEDIDRERIERWAVELNGMFLVTGPTASGKTTTLYAVLEELVEESRHVVTIEDPVEYEIDGINQMQVDRKHGLDFAEGVRASLRLDPDCLMVGEIRSPEPAAQTINAAVQGHVVMATMHSRDAVSAITRLRNFGLEDHQIAAATGVIVNQRLIRKLCPVCRTETRAAANGRSSFLKAIDWLFPMLSLLPMAATNAGRAAGTVARECSRSGISMKRTTR